mgnify:CR=1 FL=1
MAISSQRDLGVNRQAILTPYRQPIVTPIGAPGVVVGLTKPTGHMQCKVVKATTPSPSYFHILS